MKYYGYFENKFKKAVKFGDMDILAYFYQYGDDEHCIQNACRYEACKECGFTEPFHVNEYGWCDNGKVDIENIPVFEGREYATIHVAQLPNNMWVGEHSVGITNSGRGGLPSVFSDSFPTKEDAIRHMLRHIEDFIRRNAKNPEPYLKKTSAFWNSFGMEQLSLF